MKVGVHNTGMECGIKYFLGYNPNGATNYENIYNANFQIYSKFVCILSFCRLLRI